LFAGTPAFAVLALDALVQGGFSPLAVFTQPDRPAGRGRKLQASPVKQAAERAGLPVLQPESLKDPDTRTALAAFEPDLMIVVAYGLILPVDILAIPKQGCWNIHASLLPRWRGAAPIQRAIEAGEAETGVCIMQMDKGLDTGPVLKRVSVPIVRDDTGGSLHDKLAKLGADCLLSCIREWVESGVLVAEPQPAAGVTYASKLNKAEAELDWQQPAFVLERKVRAFNPVPVTWCDLAGERTRIWSARALDVEAAGNPGTLTAANSLGIDVATSKGELRLLRLQRPGGKEMSPADYLRARPQLAHPATHA